MRAPKPSDAARHLWPSAVPSDWQLGPVKRLIKRMESGVSVNALDQPAEPGVPGVLKTSCVYTGEFDPRENKAVLQDERHLVACPVQVGGLIVSRMNTPDLVGSAGLVREPAPDLYLPDRLWQVSFEGANPRFAHYWTQSALYRLNVQAACAGSSASMQNLSQDDFRGFPIAVPGLDTQARLVDWMDRETARIDALIEKKTRFIELLREKRQALITQTVTRGLNREAPMKHSGVEWLGQVPSHWEIKPFKYCVRYQEGPGIMAADFLDEGVPLLRIACVQGRFVSLEGCNFLSPEKVARHWNHFRLEAGDLLISGSASMGVVSEVGEEAAGAVAYTGLIRLRGVSDVMERDFIRWLVVSGGFMAQIDLMKAGSTIQHFGPTHLDQMNVCCPPVDEQRDIAKFLKDQTARLDNLVTTSNRSIELLRERRSALITAAVTGQLDVRVGAVEQATEPA
jgi:type I restriction enzyme, S subunit